MTVSRDNYEIWKRFSKWLFNTERGGGDLLKYVGTFVINGQSIAEQKIYLEILSKNWTNSFIGYKFIHQWCPLTGDLTKDLSEIQLILVFIC